MSDDELLLHLSIGATEEGHVTLRVGGEVDFVSSHHVRKELLRLIHDHPASLTVDLAELTFMDSSGLSALIAGWQAAEAAHTPLALASVPPFLGQVLQITGLTSVLPIRSSVAPGGAVG